MGQKNTLTQEEITFIVGLLNRQKWLLIEEITEEENAFRGSSEAEIRSLLRESVALAKIELGYVLSLLEKMNGRENLHFHERSGCCKKVERMVSIALSTPPPDVLSAEYFGGKKKSE